MHVHIEEIVELPNNLMTAASYECQAAVCECLNVYKS